MRTSTMFATLLSVLVPTVVASVAGALVVVLRRPAPVLVPVRVDRRQARR